MHRLNTSQGNFTLWVNVYRQNPALPSNPDTRRAISKAVAIEHLLHNLVIIIMAMLA